MESGSETETTTERERERDYSGLTAGSASEPIVSTLTETGSVATDSSSPSSSSTAKTFLSSLRQPAPSKLARIRKVQCNPPIGKKRSAAGRSAYAPTTVQTFDRVKQYPDEHFIVSAKKLFCTACREEISTKKSVINLHIKSTKHASGKKKFQQQNSTELTIAEALKSYDSSHHTVGESLPDSTRVFSC